LRSAVSQQVASSSPGSFPSPDISALLRPNWGWGPASRAKWGGGFRNNLFTGPCLFFLARVFSPSKYHSDVGGLTFFSSPPVGRLQLKFFRPRLQTSPPFFLFSLADERHEVYSFRATNSFGEIRTSSFFFVFSGLLSPMMGRSSAFEGPGPRLIQFFSLPFFAFPSLSAAPFPFLRTPADIRKRRQATCLARRFPFWRSPVHGQAAPRAPPGITQCAFPFSYPTPSRGASPRVSFFSGADRGSKRREEFSTCVPAFVSLPSPPLSSFPVFLRDLYFRGHLPICHYHLLELITGRFVLLEEKGSLLLFRVAGSVPSGPAFSTRPVSIGESAPDDNSSTATRLRLCSFFACRLVLPSTWYLLSFDAFLGRLRFCVSLTRSFLPFC